MHSERRRLALKGAMRRNAQVIVQARFGGATMENDLILTSSRFSASAASTGAWILGGALDDLPDSVAWLWEGYLAPGNITLLTSQWKSGKTTLMSILLSRLREAGRLAIARRPSARRRRDRRRRRRRRRP